MMLFSKKVKLLLVAVTALGAGLMAVVNFTDACRLESVTLDGELLDDWQERFDVLSAGPILNQSLDSLAKLLLSHPGVFKVDLAYGIPHALHIRTNDFTPSCFLLDQTTGRLLGLDAEGRVVPLAATELDWEHPVLTNVKADKLFSHCPDVRVPLVVDRLERLYETHRDLYRLIDEIDFSDEVRPGSDWSTALGSALSQHDYMRRRR